MKHARYYWLLLAESHLTRRLFGAMLGMDRGAILASRVGDFLVGADFGGEKGVAGKGVGIIGRKDSPFGLLRPQPQGERAPRATAARLSTQIRRAIEF
jgi:hypothetical protein